MLLLNALLTVSYIFQSPHLESANWIHY